MKRVLPALVLFTFACANFAQLSGPLSGTLGPGIYHVIDTISVESEDTLRLLAGTTFTFDGGYPFRIYGTLLAEGMANDSIVFTTDTLANPDRWRGLRFTYSGSSRSSLAYCLIEKGCAWGEWPNNCGGGVYCSGSSPSFTRCTIAENFAGEYGGGVNCDFGACPNFSYCTISDNGGVGLGFWGGGVLCYGSSPYFSNCAILRNSISGFGGGVSCEHESSPRFVDCIISDNIAGMDGGGVFCRDSSPVFSHCVIGGNQAPFGGGICCCYSCSAEFVNCTVSSNSTSDRGGGVHCFETSSSTFNSTVIAFSTGEGIYFEGNTGSQILHCDFFANTDGMFAGIVPAGLGQVVTVNANGDSCDIYSNIFLNPMFVDTAAGDFRLLAESPCIDAGDPILPLDPDNTIADIGAFYFDQSAAEPFAILLPTAHVLHPNWPNPFNASTMIRYDVPQAGKVSLTIFNLLGQRVATLFDGRQLAGSHAIAWDAADMPSGVYLCRMEAAGFTQTRKMVLVK